MANIIIEAVAGKSYFKASFGCYAEGNDLIPDYKYFWAEDLLEVDHHLNKVVLQLKETKADEWELSTTNTQGVMVIDSVLGVVPTDNNHLTTLLADLKG